MSEWQTIDTAPKDGRRILVGRFDPKGSDHHPNNIIAVDFWHTRRSYSFEGFGQFNDQFWPATHWMELPEPPK